MKRRLAVNIGFLLMFMLMISFAYPVFAEDSLKDGKSITLTINWLEDEPTDRPESIKVELYRRVDDQDVPMDSRVISKSDSISTNTWQVSFPYYYGEVWEYAFKINSSEPPTALYTYQMIESGNGTDHYTFDFVYGHGSTTMTIQAVWEEDEKGPEDHPDSITVDLFSLSGDREPEREVIMSGATDAETWTATVHGLKDSPSNYYIQISGLPSGYTYIVNRGYEASTYIATISYDPSATVTVSQDLNSSEALAGQVTDIVNSLSGGHLQQRFNLILIPLFSVIVILAGISLILYYKQRHKGHRKKLKRK